MVYSIAVINQMDQDDFIETLGEIFEDTPAIAAQAWHKKPFINIEDLHQKMVDVVTNMDQEEKLALICAHPDLGSKSKMADASVQEQASVGLNQLLPKELQKFQELNQQYKDKFGFPFIIAVKNYSVSEIISIFIARLDNPKDVEQQQALAEIFQIASFRLQDIIN
ncbi:MAG: 2-oxo-4-hydroxy-4-carboxy-5-ureidoimidazoline decarboxylase [Limnothrix sp.]